VISGKPENRVATQKLPASPTGRGGRGPKRPGDRTVDRNPEKRKREKW